MNSFACLAHLVVTESCNRDHGLGIHIEHGSENSGSGKVCREIKTGEILVESGLAIAADHAEYQFGIAIDQAFGPQFTLMSSLGQTECTAGLTTCFPEDSIEVRSTTVGHFMDHVESRIADISTGLTLPVGEAGDICVRGYLNMQGYYKQPDLTAKVIDKDGWVHTGAGPEDRNGHAWT